MGGARIVPEEKRNEGQPMTAVMEVEPPFGCGRNPHLV